MARLKRALNLEKVRPQRTFSPPHEEPRAMWLEFILLPYGEFYEKTKVIAQAKKGDILRFFNGPEVKIHAVRKIQQDGLCDLLCRMRYGISWQAALSRWQNYALMEGYGKDAISKRECLIVFYEIQDKC